jgi:hypothetical protein
MPAIPVRGDGGANNDIDLRSSAASSRTAERESLLTYVRGRVGAAQSPRGAACAPFRCTLKRAAKILTDGQVGRCKMKERKIKEKKDDKNR